jgi:hypothetical protein
LRDRFVLKNLGKSIGQAVAEKRRTAWQVIENGAERIDVAG